MPTTRGRVGHGMFIAWLAACAAAPAPIKATAPAARIGPPPAGADPTGEGDPIGAAARLHAAGDVAAALAALARAGVVFELEPSDALLDWAAMSGSSALSAPLEWSANGTRFAVASAAGVRVFDGA